MTGSLLAHVVSRFSSQQWENVATESLRYLLDGSAGEAPARVLSPVPGLSLQRDLRWRAQVGSEEDPGIPDLIGFDERRRPVLMIEGKFWAALTEHQPITYLKRQAGAFVESRPIPTEAAARDHALVFLVPARRELLVARQLEERMGCRARKIAGMPILDNGQLVVVVSWRRMLETVRTCLSDADDHVGLRDLEQLAGLCDRADTETVLPFGDEDFDDATARRMLDFHDLVDRVTDVLVAADLTSTKGLKATSTRGHYGRYQRHLASGRNIQINYSLWWWANRYPSPLWLRLWQPGPELLTAWYGMVADGQLPHVEGPEKDDSARVALRTPRGVEADAAVDGLVEQIKRALSVLPPLETLDGRMDLETEEHPADDPTA